MTRSRLLLTTLLLGILVPRPGAADLLVEGPLAPHLGEPSPTLQPLFATERFPNIVVTKKGTIVATYGNLQVRARRSMDGGLTWGPEISVADPGFHGGGTTVDETSGDILAFVEEKHPPAPLAIYRSKSYGLMGGLTRLPVKDRDILIFSNIDTPNPQRERATVWASFDGGQTWPVKRLVYEGRSAYSALTAGRPGTASEGWVYLHFEGGPEKGGSQVARFNLSWLLAGEPTGDGAVPPLGKGELIPALGLIPSLL